MTLGRYLLLTVAVASTAAGCSAAYKTDILRKDQLSDAQQVIADTVFNHGELTVAASTDRRDTTYDPGQPVTLSVRTNKNAYVAILRVLPDGDTAIVFPNRAHRGAAIAADTVLTVPGPGDTIKIAGGKPGIVLFEFIASTTNAGNSWLFTRAPESGSDFADLGGTTRQIAKDLVSTLKIGNDHDTAAIYLTVRIAGRGLL